MVRKRRLLGAEVLSLVLSGVAEVAASTDPCLSVPAKIAGVGSLARGWHLSLLGRAESASARRLRKSLLLLVRRPHLLKGGVDAEFLEESAS